jgi:hypothetical protein
MSFHIHDADLCEPSSFHSVARLEEINSSMTDKRWKWIAQGITRHDRIDYEGPIVRTVLGVVVQSVMKEKANL